MASEQPHLAHTTETQDHTEQRPVLDIDPSATTDDGGNFLDNVTSNDTIDNDHASSALLTHSTLELHGAKSSQETTESPYELHNDIAALVGEKRLVPDDTQTLNAVDDEPDATAELPFEQVDDTESRRRPSNSSVIITHVEDTVGDNYNEELEHVQAVESDDIEPDHESYNQLVAPISDEIGDEPETTLQEVPTGAELDVDLLSEKLPAEDHIHFIPEPIEGATEDPIDALKHEEPIENSFPSVPEPAFGEQQQAAVPDFFRDSRGHEDSFFGGNADGFAEDAEVEDPSHASPNDTAANADLFDDDNVAEDPFFGTSSSTKELTLPAQTSQPLKGQVTDLKAEASSHPGLNRVQSSDIIMGGDLENDEPDFFAEGVPLFQSTEAVNDDFFSQNTTSTDLVNVDYTESSPERPAELKRKTTDFVTGFHIDEANGKTNVTEPVKEPGETDEELAARWKAALADDDFLDDDEDGFLSDEEDTLLAQRPQTAVVETQGRPQPQQRSATFSPAGTTFKGQPTFASTFQPQLRPEPPKTESFIVKKGNYASPYDIPEDVKPVVRKKPLPFQQPTPYNSGLHLADASGNTSPIQSFNKFPPNSASTLESLRDRQTYGEPAAPPSALPARTSFSPAPSTMPTKAIRSQATGFFEDLPAPVQKPRNVSNSRYMPGVQGPQAGLNPQIPPQGTTLQPPAPPARSITYGGPPSGGASYEQNRYAPATPGMTSTKSLAASPMIIPGAHLSPQSVGAAPVQARSVSPYASAPGSTPALNNTYAPRSASYQGSHAPVSVPAPAPVPQSNYVPRNSTVQSKPVSTLQNTPSYDVSPVYNQVPEPKHGAASSNKPNSRPSTMESALRNSLGGVAEEDEDGNYDAAQKPLPPTPAVPQIQNKYSPSISGSNVAGDRSRVLSPPLSRRAQSPSRYTPSYGQAQLTSPPPEPFVPPRRSQTQSPGFTAMRSAMQAREPYQRPSSAAASHIPQVNSYSPIETHQRHGSYPNQNINPSMLPSMSGPIDDPLERYKGCPILTWSLGSNAITMFPILTNRWDALGTEQTIKSSPGEFKVRPVKDLLGDDDFFKTVSDFPGPVFGGKNGGKSRKKDVGAWMEGRIKVLEERSLDDDVAQKNLEEKTILWKLVKVCLDHDGLLEGTPEIQKIVRDILTPDIEDNGPPAQSLASISPPTVSTSEAVYAIRAHLLKGDRENAVWYAIEKSQWAHAILIASTVSPDLFKRTVQEFVRQEVKVISGNASESLAVLYEVFAGNSEDAIDDLIPPSTRMGMMMMSTTGVVDPTANAAEKLEKWRETLGLILSNRSNGDVEAISRLGQLLEGYGRIEAAHICYLFARPISVFGGADDTNTSFTLLGADHLHNPFNYGRDIESTVLSEVYELALSLAPAATAVSTIPHLQVYKLQHATLLAQYGFRVEATKYCDAISASLKAMPRGSPYFHPQLLMNLDELKQRLSQTPRESSNSWISKPTLDGISGSLLNKFNKFVAGDEDKSAGGESNLGIESGPFAKISGNTPDLSRSQSSADLYSGYNGYPGYNPGTNNPASVSNPNLSRYDPGANRFGSKPAASPYDGFQVPAQSSYSNSYEPQSTMDNVYGNNKTSLDQGLRESPYNTMSGNPYESKPNYYPHQENRNLSSQTFSNPADVAPAYGGYTPDAPAYDTHEQDPALSLSGRESYENTDEQKPAGYDTPSYGYEPPSQEFQPYVPSPDNSDDEDAKKKPKPKKSMMDDNFNVGTSKSVKPGASKSDEEEENRKMVAAIAEREKKEAEEAKKQAGKAGWFGGWFGSAAKDKKDQGPTVYKAKLGEENSFYYDPDLKKWVNKKGGADAAQSSGGGGTPPPPKRSDSPAPPPGGGPPRPPTAPGTNMSTPPPPPTSAPSPPIGGGGPTMRPPNERAPPSNSNLKPPTPTPLSRGPSPAPPISGPTSRPGSTKVEDLDDLLGPPIPGGGPKRSVGAGAAKNKGRKRYVEIL